MLYNSQLVKKKNLTAGWSGNARVGRYNKWEKDDEKDDDVVMTHFE